MDTSTSPPPGPWNPITSIGRLVFDPYRFYPDMIARYGDPFTLKAPNGHLLCTANPEHIRTIFKAKPKVYDPFAVDTLRQLIGPGSLLVLSGERHRRERLLVMPRFHGDRMRAYGEMMMRVAREQAARWEPGAPMVMLDFTTRVSRDIIIAAIFGVDEMQPERLQPYRDAIEEVIKRAHPMLFFSKATHRSFFGLGPWAKFQRAADRLHALLREDIAERRAAPDEDREDIMSLLVNAEYEDGERMSEEDLVSELVTLLVAGHETSATALSWAFYRLHQNPETLERLREELDANAGASPSELAKLPYLTAVVKETLRLFPIVPDAVRLLREPLELAGLDWPAGKGFAIASCAVHHDPNLFEEPLRFEPARFLERTYKPWEYLPFGGGHRRCVGAAFAEYEIKLVLAAVLRENELSLREKRPVASVRRNVTMGPKTGVRMQFVGRR